ncbi:hypothetical protein WJX72_007981 [[Myrmecia] bisecta]|uniref:non-specific serine/threonine protein kinase n=1 Tax=[Myrmecia] bisecta TaxID=41462 RepID=A0AAW1QFZ8_9CHLO
MLTLTASPSPPGPAGFWTGQLSPTLAGLCGPSSSMSQPSAQTSSRKRSKQEVADAFIQKLRERRSVDLDVPGVVEGIQQHFQALPTRYALDVNINSLDVLNHKRLLDSARADPSAVSFQVRPVDVGFAGNPPAVDRRPSFGNVDTFLLETAAAQANASRLLHQRSLPRPAFGSSPNLQALILEAEERLDSSDRGTAPDTTFYEVTIASVDQPKLLSRLSEALGDLNLNICEAHAFNTKDRFSLDVFVVNGWSGEGTDDLEEVLSERLQELPPPLSRRESQVSASAKSESEFRFPQDLETAELPKEKQELERTSTSAAAVAPDDWELDPEDIVFQDKIASGAFGDLYKGVYCGQDVAIKILRNVQNDTQQYQEFLQEVAIMRKVRHKNVVQFIGACTRKPNLCIVFEFMSGGSVYDYMRKGAQLKITTVLKLATEVCRGMDYLHKRKIVHRDLKAANLLLDDSGGAKIADFGVARVLDTAGVMTAETGTYRWMAPEVIEHNPYGNKADVFSFGIVIWELLTGRVPYADMTPLQAAVGVVQKGLRPVIPSTCPAPLADIMRECWARNPADRPTFEALKTRLEALWLEYRQQEDKQRPQTGLLAKFRKSKG